MGVAYRGLQFQRFAISRLRFFQSPKPRQMVSQVRVINRVKWVEFYCFLEQRESFLASALTTSQDRFDVEDRCLPFPHPGYFRVRRGKVPVAKQIDVGHRTTRARQVRLERERCARGG